MWGVCKSAATFEELAFDGGTVGMGGAAAELFDVEGGHDQASLQSTVESSQGREERRA